MNPVVLHNRLAAAALAAALAVAAATACLRLAQQPRFDFRRIEVQSALRHVDRNTLRRAIAGRLAGNFFTMRMADARAAFEAIPWVASASVRRVWPDRLVVRLAERHAIGVWSDGRVLSDNGVLFEGNPGEAELDGAAIEFSGPPEMAAQSVHMLAVCDAALASLGTRVAALDVSDRASWTVRTAAGQVLELGRDEPAGAVAARLASVAASYPAVLAQLAGQPAHIDARYDNGFAAARP